MAEFRWAYVGSGNIAKSTARSITKGEHRITAVYSRNAEKAKAFAAKCDREIIEKGCGMLGMEPKKVAEICIEGMKPHAEEIGLAGTGDNA